MNKTDITLINFLNEQTYTTGKTLSTLMGISNKSIRNLIFSINQELKRNGGFIKSKHGSGYILQITNAAAFHSYIGKCLATSKVPQTQNERIGYLIEFLVKQNKFIKMEQLCNLLYISKKTLARDLKQVEKNLHKYEITLIRRPHYGICVSGDEFNKRLCIAEQISKNENQVSSVNKIVKNSDTQIIKTCILESVQSKGFNISGVALQNLIIHLYIAIFRIKELNCVPIPEADINIFKEKPEYKIAQEIANKIYRIYDVVFPQEEIVYITIHLTGKRMYGSFADNNENIVISQTTIDIVTEMLESVNAAFGYNFRNDMDLIISLSQHVAPLEVRIRYDMKMKNPLITEIKTRYPLAYAMANHASTILTNKYKKTLIDDEVGYIALYFALAIERDHRNVRKKNILVVCSSGHGSDQFLKYVYEEKFSDFINSVSTCDITRINSVDFSKIDYVFSTVPIPCKIPVPIREVSYFLKDNDIKIMKKLLAADASENENTVLKYYDEKLFLSNVALNSKEDLLRYMCTFLSEKRNLPSNFFELVMQREKLVNTAFGANYAMPHPYKAVGDETIVCIAITQKPIWWGKSYVQLVFLVSIANKKNKELERFYKTTSKFLMSQESVREFIRTRNFATFKRIIQQIESTL